MDIARRLGGNEIEIAEAENIIERVIGHAHAARKAHRPVDVFRHIAVESRARHTQHQKRYAVVDCHRRQHHGQRLYPEADDLLDRFVPVQRVADHDQQKQTRGNGDIRLIDPKCQHKDKKAHPCAAPSPLLKEPDGKHREEKRPGIGRGSEHEAEIAGERRKAHKQGRKHKAQGFVPDVQGVKHQAGCGRDQHKAYKAVDPRHRPVGEQELHRLQAPAAGGHCRALAEEGFDFIMIEKLVCKGVAMGQQSDQQSREKGCAVILPQLGGTAFSPVKRSGIVSYHYRRSTFRKRVNSP